MKKQLVKILMVIGCGLILIPAGCKKSMDELNVNPNAPVSVSPDYLFTYSVVKGQGSYITNANLHYWLLMNWDMYFANLGGVDAGKEYDSNDGKDAYWNEVYAQALMNAKEVERLTANDPYLINKNAIARIWEAYLFSKLTDLYGDIPYSQALQGASGLNFLPAYDRQQMIYKSVLLSLKNAASDLNPTKALFPGTVDPIYNGSLVKWKAFANSLRLRLALRMSSVDPIAAQTEIVSLQGEPLIASNNESASFPYNGEIRNPLYDLINSGQSGGRTYPSKFLIDHLKATMDPRVKVFAQYTVESTIVGIPDYDGVPNLVPSGSSIWSNYNTDGSDVSKIGTWFLKQDVPGMIMSYAEVCFLKSEAALKGWYNGDAQQFYVDGVTANMQSYTGGGITVSQMNNYILNLPAVSLENIITQKWISFTYQNGFEAYNDYRRTGFPILKDYFGNTISTTAFPNRLTYPSIELSLNSANYYNAIAHQGADIASTKMWWDN